MNTVHTSHDSEKTCSYRIIKTHIDTHTHTHARARAHSHVYVLNVVMMEVATSSSKELRSVMCIFAIKYDISLFSTFVHLMLNSILGWIWRSKCCQKTSEK